jgi:hypothetical protein
VIAGVNWVTGHAIKPAVANMSLGGGASPTMDQAVTNSMVHRDIDGLRFGGAEQLEVFSGLPEFELRSSRRRLIR